MRPAACRSLKTTANQPKSATLASRLVAALVDNLHARDGHIVPQIRQFNWRPQFTECDSTLPNKPFPRVRPSSQIDKQWRLIALVLTPLLLVMTLVRAREDPCSGHIFNASKAVQGKSLSVTASPSRALTCCLGQPDCAALNPS